MPFSNQIAEHFVCFGKTRTETIIFSKLDSDIKQVNLFIAFITKLQTHENMISQHIKALDLLTL